MKHEQDCRLKAWNQEEEEEEEEYDDDDVVFVVTKWLIEGN
jgi:hypothetical protein